MSNAASELSLFLLESFLINVKCFIALVLADWAFRPH